MSQSSNTLMYGNRLHDCILVIGDTPYMNYSFRINDVPLFIRSHQFRVKDIFMSKEKIKINPEDIAVLNKEGFTYLKFKLDAYPVAIAFSESNTNDLERLLSEGVIVLNLYDLLDRIDGET